MTGKKKTKKTQINKAQYCKKCGREIMSKYLMLYLMERNGDKDTNYYGKSWCTCGEIDKDKIQKEFLKLNKNAKKEDLLWRADGRMEWLCGHRVGHTVYAPDAYFVHGCCGCCVGLKRVKVAK